MAELSKELRAALEAEESGELARLLTRRRSADFQALRSMLSLAPSIPPDFRRKAMYALGRWGDPSVVPEIRRLLPQLDEGERIAAISALGQLGTQEAVAAVIEFADDRSPQVRKSAALALKRTRSPEAEAKLRDIAVNDPLSWIRELAARRRR